MYRQMLGGKIHRASVTHADLHYVGSLTVDLDLLEAAGMLPHEKVAVVDVTNGARLETYLIAGERGSGVVGINGAAAHLVGVGDLVIIMSFVSLSAEEAAGHLPAVVHVDADNRMVAVAHDPGEAAPGVNDSGGTLRRPPLSVPVQA